VGGIEGRNPVACNIQFTADPSSLYSGDIATSFLISFNRNSLVQQLLLFEYRVRIRKKDEPETGTEESVCCVDGPVHARMHAHVRDLSACVPIDPNNSFSSNVDIAKTRARHSFVSVPHD
jgi:hypothetical protein